MRTSELAGRAGIRPLRYPLGGVPHATLETNRTCNIRCRVCYTLDRTHVKPLEAIEEELDLLLEKRNLGAVTILGGEPTLHPDLPEIVAAVKSRGLLCQLLTNGIAFLEDETDRLLDALVRAGVDRFLVHVDAGQARVHDDIERVREALFSKLERKKVNFGLSVTVFGEGSDRLPDLARRYSRFRHFDSILAVLARDPLIPGDRIVDLAGEYGALRSDLGVEPAAYVPSSLDDGSVHWLIYSYFLDARTGRTFAVSPLLNRIARRIYRASRGKHFFVPKASPAAARILFVLDGLAESCLRPGRARPFLKMLAAGTGAIRFHFIVIQVPPEVDEAARRISLCHHCPDATVRNGRLMPVCLADYISPLDGSRPEAADQDLFDAVLAHMGE